MYGRALYESEIAKYVDVHNFHCYEELVKHPALPEALDDSLMVEFEARNEQDGREENDWRFGQARFTGTFGNGDKFRSAVLNPIISQWEVRRVDSTEAARLAAAAGGGNDASDVRFGAGGSPRAHTVTLWFRNVVVLGRTPSGNRNQ